MVKPLSIMQVTWVHSLGQEDPLEKEMATHSSTLAWKIPWMEEPGAGYCPWGHKELDIAERVHLLFFPWQGRTFFRRPLGLLANFRPDILLSTHLWLEHNLSNLLT